MVSIHLIDIIIAITFKYGKKLYVLKEKVNKLAKKWSHPRGDIHKDMIVKIIQKNAKEGRYQHEIVKETRLSRQTVSKKLKELRAENKITKLSNLYFIAGDDDFDYTYFFPKFIGIFLERLLKSKENLSEVSSLPLNDNNCFDNSAEEKAIFDFSNAIGAIITYILIQSKRPYQSHIEYAKIAAATDLLLEDIINLKYIFYDFGRLFASIPENRPYETISEERFDSLSKSFMNVYPTLYRTLEDSWNKYCNSILQQKPMNNIYRNCDHQWQERYLYRFGKYNECILCGYRKATE